MKKKILLCLAILIIVCGGGLVYFKLIKKTPTEPVMGLTGELTTNLIKLTNKDYRDNYLISPYSIKVALNMLREGADGNTLTEINKLLDGSKIGTINNSSVKIANAVFINNNVKDIVEKLFVKTIKTKYNGEVLYDDFYTPDVINNWVNEHTDKMIPKILDYMDPNFIAGIANAIAIDVKWSHEFECTSTYSEQFTQKSGNKVDAQMMHNYYQTEDVKYIDNDEIKGIVIPYEEDTNLEFIGFIPKAGIDSYINNLTVEKLSSIDKGAVSASSDLHIQLSMPRFKYDFDLELFKKYLQELGMRDAFDGFSADFTKIINVENRIKKQRGNIYVDEAIHKTAIDLNEKGTKATAVTYFGLKDSAMAPSDFETVKIDLNETFIYMIKEKTSGEILFYGVVNTPNEWSGSTCNE